MGGEVRGVVAGAMIATMALAGCTSEPRDLGPAASEGCLTEAKPSDEVLVGDLDGDGEADEVHVYRLGYRPDPREPRLQGAIVMADRRLVGVPRDDLGAGRPLAIVDVDGDGIDELLLDAGGVSGRMTQPVRVVGCTLEPVGPLIMGRG